MNKVTTQVAGVVAAVAIFALLSAVGYLTQVGFSQTFGPSNPDDGGNIAERKPRSNRSYGNRASSDDPPKPEVKGWVDVPEEELTNEKRLANRPGNYQALSAALDFMDGLFQVEPEYRNIGFPLQLDSEWIATEADFKGWILPGKDGVNRKRRRNIELQSIEVFNLEADMDVADVPEALGIRKSQHERIEKLREHHVGRLVVISFTLAWEALDSDYSNEDEKSRLMLHRDDDGWKVVYIND
ncbi:MAG: hypothetical protein R3E76_02515 [Planctomycetota bacterium]